MAGPSIVNVSSIVNPYEGLQKAFSDVGDIYSNYDKEVRETAAHNSAIRDSNRVQEQRDFNRAYDPQLAIEGRGLTASTKKLYDAKEKEVAAHYQKIRDKGGKIPSAEELNTGLRDIRNSLITKEDAADVVRRDYLDQGFSPEEANAYAEANSVQYSSRADMLSSETSRVAALNEQLDARREAAKVTAGIIVDSVKANTLTAAERKELGYSKSTNWNGKDYKASALGDSDLASRTQLITAMEDSIGNGFPVVWGGDAQEAINMADKAFYGFNKGRVDAGLPPLPYSVLEKFMMAKTDSSSLGDRDTIYKDAAAMRTGMDTEWANYIPKNKDWNGTSSGQNNGSSIVPQAYYDIINDTTQIVPRTMSQLEVIKINRLFSSYNLVPASSGASPKPDSKNKSGGSKQSLEKAKARAEELQQERLDALAKKREVVNKELAEEKPPKKEGTTLPPDEAYRRQKNSSIDKLAVEASQTQFRLGEELTAANKKLKDSYNITDGYERLAQQTSSQNEIRKINNEIDVFEADLKVNKEVLDQNNSVSNLPNAFKDGVNLTNSRSRFSDTFEIYGNKRDEYTNDFNDSVEALDKTLGGLESEYNRLQSRIGSPRITEENKKLLSDRVAFLSKSIEENQNNSDRTFVNYRTYLQNYRR